MQRREFLRLTALAGITGRMRLAVARTGRARVIVIGGGFAGSAAALHLKRIDASIDVTLIDPDDRYVTCPLSNEALVGLRDLGSLTVTRKGLYDAGIRHVRDHAEAIDADRRHVRLRDGARLDYDRLIVAPGIRFLWGTPEGYDEAAAERMPHAWKAGPQTAALARQLHAMRDGGVVAISVPHGLMRCPPGPYERASLIADYLKRRKPRSKVLIFDVNNRFPRQDAFTDAWRSRYPGMIEWISVLDGGAVESVDARTRTLHTKNGAHRVAVANVIPPQAPGEIAVSAGLATGHGWCPVQPGTFESVQVPRVHVIGDACIAGAMPKAASAAVSQAAQCAEAVAALLADRAPPEPAFDSVCYSLLAPGDALAIHGRFRVIDGDIRSAPVPEKQVDSSKHDGAEEARLAEAWYARIRRQAFADAG